MPRSFAQDPILELICSTPGMSGFLPVTIPACNRSLPAVRLGSVVADSPENMTDLSRPCSFACGTEQVLEYYKYIS